MSISVSWKVVSAVPSQDGSQIDVGIEVRHTALDSSPFASLHVMVATIDDLSTVLVKARDAVFQAAHKDATLQVATQQAATYVGFIESTIF